MSNDQESIPKMQASQEDMAMRQKHLQQRRLAAQRAAKVSPASPQIGTPAPKQTLATVALILSLGMGGFAGFLFMQLQEANSQLIKAEGILNGHAINLAVLNDKLSASDENSTLSVGALKVLLKDNAKEIRKLWDLTNKTNKPNIEKNLKAISGVKTSVIKVDNKATAIDKKVVSANSNISGNKNDISTNENNISGNQNSIAALKISLANSQKSLEAKLTDLKSSMTGLPEATEVRIGNNEQSIRSIDATRKKLNSSMAEVESQFNEMKLEIEDIQMRLDRMQNAMTGTL
ncbi:MAG: chromosome segregation ATPase [Oleispira sp.]|jgi:chromosome segregation ATPase